jgi:hypothetical protein
MKYERKSPYADGFNDIYTTAGVDAGDVWARKRLLLGGDGGGDGGAGGHHGTDPAVDNPATVAEAEAEAAAVDAAKGEMEAYSPSMGFVTDALGITKGFDQFGPKGVNIDFSIPALGLLATPLGPVATMVATKGISTIADAFGVPSTMSVNIGTPGAPAVSFGPSQPGAVDAALGAIGVDTTAATQSISNAISDAVSSVTDPGQTTAPSASVSAPGVSTPSTEAGMMAGFAPDPGYSPSGAVTSFAARGYRQGGAVQGGIGSLVSIR